MLATIQLHPPGPILQGVTVADGVVAQFRGIQYGIIPGRFQKAVMVQCLPPFLQCTSYGPRCPQNGVDFRRMLKIPPEERRGFEVPEDEFRCLNLDITMPSSYTDDTQSKEPLPVLVWIHGGSQAVTFGSSASGLCDPTNLVKKSIDMGQPIIVVTLNYRLNIFAFGDCKGGEMNLALSDQRAALDFIRLHIRGFGGDPENITLAGESAGAVYVHAHMAMGVPMRQAILQSGSLYLSPPLSTVRASSIAAALENHLRLKSPLGGPEFTLQTAPVEDILKTLEDTGTVSLYLQTEAGLQNWREELGQAKRLLIGDCEFESAFLRNGVEAMTAQSICDRFDLLGGEGAALKALYGIYLDRPTSCRSGALDLLNDVRFTIATEDIVKQWRSEERRVFRYLVDEANPWQPSARAHHTVDLPLLFGSFDLRFNPGASRVSSEMSTRWIQFIAGQEPWDARKYFAFGPLGNSMEVDEDGFAARRRKRHCDAIRKLGVKKVDEVWMALAKGNISLNN